MASWPLSREAVEAAARVIFAETGKSQLAWSDLKTHGATRSYERVAEDALRAALAAWVPSEGQVERAANAYLKALPAEKMEGGARAALLAAVRTEAAE